MSDTITRKLAISDVPCLVQPTVEEWDERSAEHLAGEVNPVEEKRQIQEAARFDGAWIVQWLCFDCRIAFYADDEWQVCNDASQCPKCGGSRGGINSLPMARRAEKFAAIGKEPTEFGTVQLDFKNRTDFPSKP